MRRHISHWSFAALLLAALSLAPIAAPPESEAVDPKIEGPSPIQTRGEIVDCSEYMLMGKKGPERRDTQARNIDAGMPACFIADDGEVYLLVEFGNQARQRFQPTPTFIAGDVMLDGVVYQRGSLKAVSINSIARTGTYTDRQTRRPANPTPTRHEDISDPKKSPYVPTLPTPAEPPTPSPTPN